MQPEGANVIDHALIASFGATWIVLGVGGGLVFWLGKNAAFKRKWFPRFTILACVLFVAFGSAIFARSSTGFELLGCWPSWSR